MDPVSNSSHLQATGEEAGDADAEHPKRHLLKNAPNSTHATWQNKTPSERVRFESGGALNTTGIAQPGRLHVAYTSDFLEKMEPGSSSRAFRWTRAVGLSSSGETSHSTLPGIIRAPVPAARRATLLYLALDDSSKTHPHGARAFVRKLAVLVPLPIASGQSARRNTDDAQRHGSVFRIGGRGESRRHCSCAELALPRKGEMVPSEVRFVGIGMQRRTSDDWYPPSVSTG